MNNIALIGFMGTGKTSVGILLAHALGWDFLDTDKMIEEKMGMDIPAIFAEHGEEFFRLLEKEAVQVVCRCRKHVIATGGGVILNQTNVDLLKEHTFIICLEANPEDILNRVRCDASRPLLAVDNPLKIINNLLKLREPFYQCADLFIDTSGKDVEKIVGEILGKLRQRGIAGCQKL